MGIPNTPLARPIIRNTKGQDVLAVKRALSRAGYLEWDSFSTVAGPFFIDAVHAFQHDHGIKLAGYGPHTHATLLRTKKEGSRVEYAWDSYSLQLEHAEYVQLHTTPEQLIRSSIIQAARNLYSYRADIAYDQDRPFSLYRMGGVVPRKLDCSGFVTNCYYAAKAKNPNNRPYDGEGYTGTLLGSGKKVGSWTNLKPGDLVFYGYTTRATPAFPYGSPTHVALYAGDGTVYSMGHYPMSHLNVYYGMAINSFVTYDVTP